MRDEDLGNLNVVHKLILPHRKESEETTSKLDKLVKKREPGSFAGHPTPGISPQKSGAAFDELKLQLGNATLECGRKQEEHF